MSERLDRIEKILEETAKFRKETEFEIREIRKETAEFRKETEFEIREIRKETAEFRKETEFEIREIRKENAQFQKETIEFQNKTTKNIDKLSKEFGAFTNNQGDIVEILFFNTLKETLTLNGVKYDSIALNVERETPKTEQEFDIVLVNSNQVAIVEVKGKAHLKDIEKLDKIVTHYKILFPEHKSYKIQSYLGSLHFTKKIKEEAKESKHKLLLLKGNAIEVLD